MSGVLRLANTGAATGRSTLEATATSDATFSLPSAGGTLLTSNYSAVGTITLDGSTVNITNGDLNVDSGTLFVDESTNRVGIGTTAPNKLFEVSTAVTDGPVIRLNNTNTSVNTNDEFGRIEWNTNDASAGGTGISNYIAAHAENAGVHAALTFGVRDDSGVSEAMRINKDGKIGIGETDIDALLVIKGNSDAATTPSIRLKDGTDTREAWITNASGDLSMNVGGNDNVAHGTLKIFESGILDFAQGASRVRIDTSGNVGIGVTSPNAILHTSTNATDAITLYLENRADAGSADKNGIVFALRRSGGFAFSGTRIRAEKENSWTGTPSTINSALTFSTYYQESASEKVRITSNGDLTTTGTSTFSRTNAGFTARKGDSVSITRNGGTPLEVNRGTNDGNLVNFFGQNVAQGTITVSGSTVSYNGGHLARWSQLASGAARIEILRGSVLSNLDEMCEWGDEDNEQLNRMKVSDVEGDRNVAGVFQAWDDDDDTYVNDFYCAMTGDFVIRIGKDVTVERGDLLMSAGDGTAKPQDDDIIRSKTIAKVTSTAVSETYADGSYCVPCVLMAC